MLQEKKSSRLWFYVRLFFTIALFAWVSGFLDWKKIFSALEQVHKGLFLAVLLMYVPKTVLAALTTQVLLRTVGVQKKVRDILHTNFSAYFFSFCGDWLGGLVRWHGFSGEEERRGEALFSMIIEKYQLVFLSFWVFWQTSFFGITDPFKERDRVIVRLGTVFFGSAIAVMWALLFTRLIPGNAPEHGPAAQKKAWFYFFVQKAKDMFRVRGNFLINRKGFWISLGYLFVNMVLGFIAFVIMLRAIDIRLGIYETLWVWSFLTLVQSVPITIYGLGIREGTLMFALSHFGISYEISFAFGILWFLVMASLGIAGGVWFMCKGLPSGPLKGTRN